jgi:hypothetical protein
MHVTCSKASEQSAVLLRHLPPPPTTTTYHRRRRQKGRRLELYDLALFSINGTTEQVPGHRGWEWGRRPAWEWVVNTTIVVRGNDAGLQEIQESGELARNPVPGLARVTRITAFHSVGN